jgi:hypothetical protein
MEIGANLSYTYAKGHPYYDIATEFNDGKAVNYTRNEGKLKDYNALNFSFNYLPAIGKKMQKHFRICMSITKRVGI